MASEKQNKSKMTAKKAEILAFLFGPPPWVGNIPDELVVLTGYGGFYTHKMPEHNTVIVMSTDSLAMDFIEALEDTTWIPKHISKDDLIDKILREMPLVDALAFVDVPENPVIQQIRFP